MDIESKEKLIAHLDAYKKAEKVCAAADSDKKDKLEKLATYFAASNKNDGAKVIMEAEAKIGQMHMKELKD